MWLPHGFERRAPVIEVPQETLVAQPAPTNVPRVTLEALEESPLPTIAAPASRPRAPAKSEVRPRLLSDPQSDAIPRVLPKLVYDVQIYSVLLDVCVSAQGRVAKASIVQGQDAALDRQIVEAVERWNYAPGEAGGQPVPMCFPLVYRIQVQRD